MPKRIALVDADGILYAAAAKGEVICDGEQLQLLDISVVFKDALSRIEETVSWAKADDAFIILSDRRNFRTDILPSYKGNRKPSKRPLLLDELRKLMAEEAPYKVMLIKGLEADDVCGIAAGQLQKAGNVTVIVSPDKDLLQIPGWVLTPLPGGKRVLAEITEAAADRWHLMQTLTGDQTDGYKGCPRWGPRKAGNLMDQLDADGASPAERWAAVVAAYAGAGLTEEDALVQARVSRICRVSDWDPINKEVILWEPQRDAATKEAA